MRPGEKENVTPDQDYTQKKVTPRVYWHIKHVAYSKMLKLWEELLSSSGSIVQKIAWQTPIIS